MMPHSDDNDDDSSVHEDDDDQSECQYILMMMMMMMILIQSGADEGKPKPTTSSLSWFSQHPLKRLRHHHRECEHLYKHFHV